MFKMPERLPVLQFVVLLLAVPAQLLIATYFSSTSIQRNYQVQKLLTWASEYKEKFLSWETWHNWYSDILTRITSFKLNKDQQTSSYDLDESGESVAVEVIKYRNPRGHFGMSTEPRSPRSEIIKYRVGQVVQHKQYKYRGVIVGWDAVGKAPSDWLAKSTSQNKQRWKNQPNYSILIDVRDRSRPQMAYVAEEFLEILENTKVLHPEVDKYFEEFDGTRYLPRPRLKVLYPHD